MNVKILLLFFVISFMTKNAIYAQSEMTEENFYLWSIKRAVATIPEDGFNIIKKAAVGYASYWDKSNYNNSKSNEFEKKDYEDKIFTIVNSKIERLSYQTNYYHVVKDKLLDYDFDNQSFTTTGSQLFVFNRFSSISFSSVNSDKFLAVTFYINREKAKKLLASKTYSTQTDRTVFKKVHFKVIDFEKFGVTIVVNKVELFGDVGLTNKLSEVIFEPSIFNDIDATHFSLGENNMKKGKPKKFTFKSGKGGSLYYSPKGFDTVTLKFVKLDYGELISWERKLWRDPDGTINRELIGTRPPPFVGDCLIIANKDTIVILEEKEE